MLIIVVHMDPPHQVVNPVIAVMGITGTHISPMDAKVFNLLDCSNDQVVIDQLYQLMKYMGLNYFCY